MKYTYGIVLAVIVLVAVGIFIHTFDSPQGAAVATSEPVRLGFVGPLTGDGAAWGEIEKNAIDLAVEEINASGGLNGRPLVVTYEDGQCDGSTALTAAKKLVEVDNIKILLVSCSQELLPIAPYAEARKVIAWTSYASATGITNAGEYIFRNSYTNDDMARAMAEQALKRGKRIAILTEQSAFASDLGDLFVTSIAAEGGSVVSNEHYLQGSRDFRTYVSKMLATMPDVIVINPNGPDTGLAILEQLHQQGYRGPLVGNFFGGSTKVHESPAAQGMVYVSDPVFAESPIKQKVFDAYKAKYGAYPDLPWPLGARYDAIYMLKEALEAVGEDPTKLKEYLHHLPKDFTGVLGTYRFNADNANITNIKPSVAKIEGFTSIPAN